MRKKRQTARPGAGPMALLCLAAVLSGGGTVLLALAVRQVVNAGLAEKGLLPWGAVLVALAAGLVALGLWQRWYAGETRDKLIRQTRQALLTTLLSRRYDALDGRHSGELVSRLGEDVAIVCGERVALLPGVAGSAVRLAGALAALAFLSRGLALCLLALGAALLGAAGALRFPMRRRARLVREAESAVGQGFQESLEHREAAKGLRMEEALSAREAGLLDRALDARRRQRSLSLLASGGLNAAAQLGYCAALIWGVVRTARGELDFGALTAVLQLLLQLRGPVVSLSGLTPRLAALSASRRRLEELEELPEEGDQPLPPGTKLRAVVFDRVDFRYPGDPRPVLQNFSQRVEAGEWLCLTGVSGRGKTTLFKLLLGFYTPQAGRVYLETDRGDLPCGRGTRALLGYVPQDHALFSGTVRENLLLAAPGADETALWAALEGAGAGFVRDLPQGLDTVLGENGAGLSEGQGQRIALARALLLDAPFLLLDEATAALDRETETLVLRRLRESGRGALLISHRPEAMPSGTTILPMEEAP